MRRCVALTHVASERYPFACSVAFANSAIVAISVTALTLLFGSLSAYTIARQRFRWTMFLLQAVIFMLLPRVQHFAALATLSFVVLLCYGGGFGTMPAFAADIFGPANIGSIYGLMLTAWGFAAA